MRRCNRERSLTAIIPVVLFALATVLAICPAAAAPAMDTDLSLSSASFVGEAMNDWFGYSVAIAGDVNGDGYDDILVGAPHEGNSKAGKTYLFFGNLSGWSSDLDASKANASFVGEGSDDYSGYSVAGAGDVNGDGYDDILIGAHTNSEGGALAGQTYLIFGRAKGWSMDMDLSNANASFLGEEASCMAGFSVAGAGDVNGDSYDDLIIGAPSIHSSSVRGKAYLLLGRSSAWPMDTSLSNANATFQMEEKKRDWVGYSVAGAGDVNDDGYDDLLIGAPEANMGGVYAGQTFLVLGRAKGWARDFNLSNASASFFGENPHDLSGSSVAGAGDVNGDGYDDFLIGTSDNDEGGTDAGQTYLVLGRANGWSTDTNLSSVNASFWGEAANDRASHSLAGVGDLNGDGYDDILIGAPFSGEAGDGAGQTYVVLGKATGWSMDTNLSGADASFLGEAVGDESGHSVAGAGDVNGDGRPDILVGAYRNDDGGLDAGKAYLLLYDDGSPPRIERIEAPPEATTGEMVTFNLTVSDNRGIRNVSFEYWYGDSGESRCDEAVQHSGDQLRGEWHYTLAIPPNSTDALHYAVHAWDRAFRSASSPVRDLAVRDNDPPELSNDTTPSLATTGDDVTFSVNVTDNVELVEVTVEYWYGDAGGHATAPMTHVGEDRWNHTVTVPSDSLDQLRYVLRAEDNSSNNATTDPRSVEVEDDDPPALVADGTPALGTTGDALAFSVEARDNIGVGRVRVVYRYGGGGTTSVDLVPSGGDLWEASVILNDTALDMLYRVVVVDTSGNTHTAPERTVDVVDDDIPVLVSDGTPSSGTTGDALAFSVEAWDNVGVQAAWVEYRYGDGDATNASLESRGDGLWEAVVVVADTLEPMRYTVGFVDGAGNANVSAEATVAIADDDAPELVEDCTPSEYTTGDPFTFLADVRDNIGVSRVAVRYYFGEGDEVTLPLEVVEAGGTRYAGTVEAPPGTLDGLTYAIVAEDASGNVLAGAAREVGGTDNDGPVIVYGDAVREVVKGLPLALEVDVEDNIGVAEAFLAYAYGDPGTFNVSMETSDGYAVELDVPRHAVGDLRFRFVARDGAGNWATSPWHEARLVNLPPVVAGLPAWNVTEGVEAELDLGPYLSDGNDPVSRLTVLCEDGTVTVEGHVLRALYDVAVPDTSVTLRVSDGENSTEVDLTVHVMNVNDAPVILGVTPANGTRLGTGDALVLEVDASDEDGDELTVTWTEGGEVLGTGTPLRLKGLSEGEHEITVAVDDGNASAERTMTVHVEAEGLGGGVVYLAAAIIIAAVAAAVLLLRRRG